MKEFNVLKRFLTTEDGQEFRKAVKKVMRHQISEVCQAGVCPSEQKAAYMLGRGEPMRLFDYIVDEYEPGENNE